MTNIFFLNDRAIYNTRYRCSLIEEFRRRGLSPHSIGLFESPVKFLFVVLTRRLYISSNLRSNILAMLLGGESGLVILNGLGRYRSSKSFRRLMIVLVRGCRANITIQNYADYRFFKRFARPDVVWICGSGGTARSIGVTNRHIVVSRRAKLDCNFADLQCFQSSVDEPIVVVGCDENDLRELGVQSSNLEAVGYVEQSDIFLSGNAFVQLPGYGEGVPHSLVDAICSGMTVRITKRDFLSFGLHKLNMKLIGNDLWRKLAYDPVDGKRISSKLITNEYYTEFLKVSK